MRERVASLTALATSSKTALSERDVERLDDATVDYLGLWLAWLVMAERWREVDEEGLLRKLKAIDDQIESTQDAVERKRLAKARTDLDRILTRRRGLWSRATEVEAKMLAMADTLEEVFQRVVTNPGSSDAANELQEAVERMKVEEEIDLAVDSELDELLHSGSAKKKKRARRQAQARRL